jgi:hypothetical protein
MRHVCRIKAKQIKANTMQEYNLGRQGLPPIKFTGIIIGQGEINGAFFVTIYKTKAGRYVGHIERRHGFDKVVVYSNATHSQTPSDVIDWLKEGEETLGKASQDAVEQACKNDPSFAAAWVEVVE